MLIVHAKIDVDELNLFIIMSPYFFNINQLLLYKQGPDVADLDLFAYVSPFPAFQFPPKNATVSLYFFLSFCN